MKFEIKNWLTGSVLFSIKTDTWKLAIEAAVEVKAATELRRPALRPPELRQPEHRQPAHRQPALRRPELRQPALRRTCAPPT